MTLTRKKLIIIAVWIVALMTAIITAVLACRSNSDNGGNGGGTGNKPKNPYTCTVTFDAGDGTINGERLYTVTIDKNTTVARPTAIPQRKGHIFWGWNTTGREDDPMWLFDAEKISQDTFIYAVWVKECTVTFYAEEGAFENGTHTCTVTAPYGTKVTAPTVTPHDEYMELQGWETSLGNSYDLSNEVIQGDLYLYAKLDIKKDVQRQLAPFRYARNAFGYTVTGVVDNSVSAITIPSVVTWIDTAAFSSCRNLVSITMHDGVTYIGQKAFQNCENLKSIILSAGLEGIEKHTFDGCTALENIRIPDTVTEIDEHAFSGCTSLKSIEIPSGVTEVKYDTFYGCTALKQVKLGNNVTEIGSHAFEDCTALADIQIPTALEKLGSSAFAYCTALKSIIIPATCKNMNSRVFRGCSGLTSAELHCETIAVATFMDCTALTDVVIGDEVRTIEDGAFVRCAALTEIDISDGVTTLEEAFIGCSNLRTVTIGDGVAVIDAYAFRNCYNLKSVTIGGGVKEIKSYAFSGCVALLSITIPSNVETVATNAFYGCSNLMEAYNLSNASLSFDSYVKVHTDASEESIVHYTDDGFLFVTENDKPTLVKYLGDEADIVLPDDCNGESYSIYDRALAYHPQLNSVKFSAGVKEIGGDILLGSDNVTSLTVDSANPIYSSSGNCVIKPNSQELILCCKTSVIPDDGSVRCIMSNVFCHNATIVNESFRIPDSVQWVYRYAFAGCYGLMRTADNGVVYVDRWVYAFDCENSGELVDIELDAGTVGICNAAFYRSNASSSISKRNAIRSVKFNAELKYVGDGAFAYCENLTEIIMNDGLLSIMNDAFYGCNKLQDVVVPDSVYFLGPTAFGSCANLKYVKLPASSVVQQKLFSSCEALESVVIPQAVTLIGQGLLLGCPDTVAVYYEGSEEQWSAINIYDNNDVLNNATKYFYSETEIEGVNCWHYGADGKPTTIY